MAEVGPKTSNERPEILLEWKDVRYAVHIKDTKNKTEFDKTRSTIITRLLKQI